jgi:hypothetical protein
MCQSLRASRLVQRLISLYQEGPVDAPTTSGAGIPAASLAELRTSPKEQLELLVAVRAGEPHSLHALINGHSVSFLVKIVHHASQAVKIQPERQLSRPVAALPRGLRRLQDAERFRAADVGRRRREVGVIQALVKVASNRNRSARRRERSSTTPRRRRWFRVLQDTDARVSDSSRARGRRRECIDVPQDAAARRGGISDCVRPRRDAAPSNDAGVRLIQGGADGGGQPRPGLDQRDRVHIPAAQYPVDELTLALQFRPDQTVTGTCPSAGTAAAACPPHFRAPRAGRIDRRKG